MNSSESVLCLSLGQFILTLGNTFPQHHCTVPQYNLIYLLTQTDFAMCHTASVMLYRRDADNLNEPNCYPFATVCNRYVLIQCDV